MSEQRSNSLHSNTHHHLNSTTTLSPPLHPTIPDQLSDNNQHPSRPHHHPPDLFPIFHPHPQSTTRVPPPTTDPHLTPHLTPHLHLTNEFAGDLLKSRDNETTRLVFGNVNGLQLGDKGYRLDSICKDIQFMEADLVGLAETNIDDTKFEVNQLLHSTMKQNFQHYSLATSSSSIPAASTFKPGGTLNLVHDDLVGRISSKGSDHLGRWSYHKLFGKLSKVITIITAYQVCKRSNTAVTSDEGMTAYVQQERLLREEGHPNINPRKHFCKDLILFIKKLRTDGDSVILCGDFNEILDMRSPLIQLCSDPALQMVDILSTLHPTTSNLPTCDRGSTRIDFVLMSPDLVSSVRSCGFLPFRLFIDSDHRFIFLDLSTASLFGDPSKLASVPSRDIRAKDPKAVTTYLEAKNSHLENNNFYERLDLLMKSKDPLPDLAESLDALLLQASLHAGKKCRAIRREWWSSDLAKANEKVLILNMAKAHVTKNIPFDRVLSYRSQYVPADYSPPSDIESIRIELKQAQRERDIIRRESRSYRDRYLERQAEAAEIHGNREKADIMKSLLQQEKAQSTWRKISALNPLQRSKGMTSVKVPASWPTNDAGFDGPIENPKSCSDWKSVDTPKEMLYYLSKRNQLHFGQAQGTPFTVEPLSVLFNWSANTATAEQVLQGEFTSDELTDLQDLLLQHCQREFTPDPTAADSIPTITTAEWRRRISRWKESTTTSPSGMHLGHARALISRHSLDPESPEGKRLGDIQTSLIQAHVSLLNYSLQHSHSFSRWKNVVNVMIEKDPGDVRIHRLRVIHLYEHDFGLFLALYWKQMLRASEARGTINDGQYGGRAGLEAQSLVFLEEVKTEICTLSRKSLVNFDNDAASCYDRIIPSLASLIGRKKGLHTNVVYVHATTLREAKYKLKTAMGVSDDFYQHCTAYPIYGTGQGSTNSPVIWIIISSTLFDIHNQRAHGAYFCSPDQSTSISFSIVGFVDDSNCQTNNFLSNDQTSCVSLIAEATADAQLWADLLWLSGGYLELPKCSYHLIHFDFLPNGRPFMINKHLGQSISIIDAKDGQHLTIPQKAPGMPHKTLGHFKAPMGNSRTQKTVLRDKCNETANTIMRSSLTSSEARIYYDAVFLPSVNYVLPQCFFSASELRTIGSKAQQAFAVKCGFSRSTSLAVRYGPKELGGAGFLTLETLQGEGQILNLLKHLRTNSNISSVLKSALGWAQLVAGVEEPILAFPSLGLPHLEGRLFPSIRRFLHTIKGSIEVDEPSVPLPQRQHDRYLMNMAMNSRRFSDAQIRLLNFCRLYLQVVTLSDIVLADGYTIDPAIRCGTISIFSSTTKWLHVNQRRPNPVTWRVWKSFMRMISRYLDDHPLGDWLHTPARLRRSWPVYVDDTSKRVFLRSADGFFLCYRRAPSIYSIGWRRVDLLPDTAIPAMATLHDDDVLELHDTTCHHQAVSIQSALPMFTDFSSYVAALPAAEQQLLEHVTFYIGPFEIIQRCQSLHDSGTTIEFLTVSDGSSANGSMSFGWKCVLPDGTPIAEACGPAYGSKATSYRSEGYGVASATTFFLHLFKYCDIPPCWAFHYVSDNLGLINRLNTLLAHSEHFPNITLQPDWDILRTIQMATRDLGRPSTFSHVKGHQDDHHAYEDLSLEARLNVDADSLAGEFRKHDSSTRPLVPRFSSNYAQLQIDGQTISGSYRQAIRRATSFAPLMSYIQLKNSWSLETVDMVDWRIHSAVLKARPKRSVQLTKLCHEILPTATRINKYDPRQSPNCPRCLVHLESIDHLLQCPVPARTDWAVSTLRQLSSVSIKRSEHHDIILDIFVSGLEHWMSGICLPVTDYPAEFHDLIQSQESIGWNQLLRGRVSILWAKHVDELVSSKPTHHPSSSGHLWVKSMILKLWDQFFVLWEERNAVVHGADQSEQTKCRKARLLRELHQLHELRSEVLPADQIFFISTDTSDDAKIDTFVQAHGPTFLQNWINVYRPLFLQSQRDALHASTRGSRPITHYFTALRTQVLRVSRTVHHRASAAIRRRATNARVRPLPQRRKPPDHPGPRLPSYFTRS